VDIFIDTKTVILMLAIGSFLYGLLLIIFKYKKDSPQDVPFWITTKLLQAAGSLLIYATTGQFDMLAHLGNIFLLLGCAYEAWAIRVLSGKNIKRWLHLTVSVAIIAVCLSTELLPAPNRGGVFFLMQSLFYFLPAVFLLNKSKMNFQLQVILAANYCLVGAVFVTASAISLFFPGKAMEMADEAIAGVIPISSFIIFLTSGFIMLMLAKERSDLQVREIRESLRKTETQYQQIVETAIEGILIMDQQYRITFANENMAYLLGYSPQEMVGKLYKSFFPESHLDVYYQQESLRRKGEASVYECCLLTREGKKHWFLISAKPLMDDKGNFEGSFAMLTDINDRKEMELLLAETNRRLTELSNQDSLTGIANRRRFDAVLDHEYNRLRRSRSRLSVIYWILIISRNITITTAM